MKTRALTADGVGVVSVHDEHPAADATIAAHTQRIISECHAQGVPVPAFDVSTFNDARKSPVDAATAPKKKGTK